MLLHIHLRYGVVGITPHVGLNGLGVAGEDILPVSFSELAECEVSDLTELAVALLIPDAAFSQILDREVHTLKLVEKTDVPQGTICRARNQVPSSVHHWIVLPAIEPDFAWRLSMA